MSSCGLRCTLCWFRCCCASVRRYRVFHHFMGAVITGQEGDSRPRVARGAAQEQVSKGRDMAGAFDQAAITDHLFRVQQAVGPVAIGNTVHAGEVIGREYGTEAARKRMTSLIDQFSRPAGKTDPKPETDTSNTDASTKSDEPKVFSGPQPGEKIPGFKVAGVYDDQAGKEFDWVEQTDGKPLVMIIVHKLTRPSAAV